MPLLTIRTSRFPNTLLAVDGPLTVQPGTYPLQAVATLAAETIPAGLCTDSFLFWNAGGSVVQNTVAQVTVGSTDVVATRWYRHGCPGPGNGDSSISTAAYSIDDDRFLNDSPIATAVPANGWNPGDSSVNTHLAGVSVTAKASVLDAGTAEAFDSWTVFPPGGNIGPTLTVAQDTSVLAFANYQAERVPIPWPDHVLELVKFYESVRARVIDWVSDPAPMDLIRFAVREATEQGAQQADTLTSLVQGIDELDYEALKLRMSAIHAQTARLDAANKLAAEALEKLSPQ